jgi:hypothetical protein
MDGFATLIPINFSRSKYQLRRLANTVKQPYAFGLKSGERFAFAGVWDGWKDPSTGHWLQSYAIITTTQTNWQPQCTKLPISSSSVPFRCQQIIVHDVSLLVVAPMLLRGAI